MSYNDWVEHEHRIKSLEARLDGMQQSHDEDDKLLRDVRHEFFYHESKSQLSNIKILCWGLFAMMMGTWVYIFTRGW